MILLGGLLCLLVLVLLLVVAERKARTAIHRRQKLRVRDVMTPEELVEWRAKLQKVHTGEIRALEVLDEEYATREKKRSGEWKRAHESSDRGGGESD